MVVLTPPEGSTEVVTYEVDEEVVVEAVPKYGDVGAVMVMREGSTPSSSPLNSP